MEIILSGTGHRCNKLPDKETGYNYNNSTYKYIRGELAKILDELHPKKIISGMALGYDTLLAEAAIERNIPLLAAIPFVGQERIWPKTSQDHYNHLLSKAAEQVIVCEGGYSAYKMQVRNRWMCDNSNVLVACYNGDKSGGTYNCVQYAQSIGMKIIYIDPRKADK